MNMRKVKKIFKKDALDLLRSRSRLIAIFLFPMIMIFFFGVGLGGQVTGVDTLVVIEDNHSPSSIMFEQAMLQVGHRSDLFEVDTSYGLSRIESRKMIEEEKYDALVYVPRDFSLDKGGISDSAPQVEAPRSENIEVLVDPTKSQQLSAAVLEGVRLTVDRLQGGLPPVEASKAYGDLEYIDFLAPAIIVLTIFFGAGQGTGRALAGEKEEGTLDRLAMTPTSSNEIIAGKTAYAVSVQLIRAVIIILAVSLIFGVVMNGSWLWVGLIVLLLTTASVGIGLALSAISEDESTYSEMSMMVILPAMFVSGVFFPVSAMPSWVQPIAYFYPLTYANNAIRKVMLIGSGFGGIAQNLLILAGFAVGLYLLGVSLFNYTARG